MRAQYEGMEYYQEEDPAVKAKLEQWQDLKFGFFVHWGPYSQKGYCESWTICSEDVDWIQRDTTISYDEYYRNYVNLKKTFNPVKFNPEYWADLAKEAGMKYFVFTTKHHDGFCMWDTKETDYKITSSECPYHTAPNPDILKELFGAFQKRDFMIGAYFSKPDWNSPYYWSDRWQHGDRNVNYKIKNHPWMWEKFCDFTYNQIKELMTGYGKVDIIWLDGGWVAPENRDQDIKMDREHADYDSAEVHEVYQAALLHDIGKTMIPVRIRCKSGSLSEVERSSMRKHTSIGHFLLLQTGTMLGTSSVVALQHHERLDGSGYLGLQDAEIHPHAKIVAVADVFDALISPRPYKRPWDIRRVSDYLKSCAGVKLDGAIVRLLLDNLPQVLALYRDSTRITCKIRISPIYTHRGRRETKLCCYRKNSISSIG